jgi:hypothetical protein
MLIKGEVTEAFTVGKVDLLNIKRVSKIILRGESYEISGSGYAPRALLRYMKHLINDA